jgi:hypothetical protein
MKKQAPFKKNKTVKPPRGLGLFYFSEAPFIG